MCCGLLTEKNSYFVSVPICISSRKIEHFWPMIYSGLVALELKNYKHEHHHNNQQIQHNYMSNKTTKQG
jgi:hypothetical protein